MAGCQKYDDFGRKKQKLIIIFFYFFSKNGPSAPQLNAKKQPLCPENNSGVTLEHFLTLGGHSVLLQPREHRFRQKNP